MPRGENFHCMFRTSYGADISTLTRLIEEGKL